MSGNGLSTRFDDFTLDRDTTDLTVCSDCSCHCGTGYISNTYPTHTLLLTIINASGICANLEGTEFTLHRGRGCLWHGKVTLGASDYCATFSTNEAGEAILEGLGVTGCFPGTNIGTGSCNPINVTMEGGRGVVALWGTCGCATPPQMCGMVPCPGQFDWVVTEAP